MRRAWPGARAPILPDEAIVLAEVKATETSRVAGDPAGCGEPRRPVTFAFHPPPPPFPFDSTMQASSGHERPSSQRLAEKAVRLAHSFSIERGSEAARSSAVAPVA